jgi:alkylhydroperoxidase family enzyme
MALVEQVRADAGTAQVSAKLKALLAIAAAVQHSGLSVTAGLVADARAAEATDLEIHDTVLIAAAFAMMNRYVDGLATIAPEDPAVYAAGAQRLISQGYLPPPAEPGGQAQSQ